MDKPRVGKLSLVVEHMTEVMAPWNYAPKLPPVKMRIYNKRVVSHIERLAPLPEQSKVRLTEEPAISGTHHLKPNLCQQRAVM